MLVIETELQRIPTDLYVQNPLMVGLRITTAFYSTHSFGPDRRRDPGGESMGKIISLSNIRVSMALLFGGVAVNVQMALVTDQSPPPRACHLAYIRETDLSERS